VSVRGYVFGSTGLAVCGKTAAQRLK